MDSDSVVISLVFPAFSSFSAFGTIWFLLNRRLKSLEYVARNIPDNYVTRERCELVHKSTVDKFDMCTESIKKDLRVLLEDGEIKELRDLVGQIKDRLVRIESMMER